MISQKNPARFLFRASHIVPIEGPDLSPGVIVIDRNIIREIGPPSLLKKYPNESITNLGDMVLFPGFVNAHCHLELTALGPLSPSPSSPPIKGGEIKNIPSPWMGEGGPADFVSWIKEVVRRKNQMTVEETKQGIKKGMRDLLQSGVATIGDHISFNAPIEEIVSSPLRGRLFGEVLGILPEVCRDIYHTLLKTKDDFQKNVRFTFHVSPHSVHAVDPDVLSDVLKNDMAPLSCHIAESKSEDDYFRKKGGDLMKWLQNRGMMAPHDTESALNFLEDRRLAIEKLMLVHGNYLSDSDLMLVKKHDLSIVHCPGSHQYFGHSPFPVKKYLDEGINVALGTDSIASNTELNFLSEIQLLREKYPDLSARQILTMATQNGAKALRMEKEIGSLVSGKKADIAGFRLIKNRVPIETPFVANRADFLMIDGRIVSGRGNFF